MRRSNPFAALVAGPAELLPVSSSAHVALLGGDDVDLHAGPLAALVLGCGDEVAELLRRLDARRAGMHLLAGAVPSAIGAALGDRRPRGRRATAAGLLAGSALLALADRAGAGRRSRWDAGLADGAWLGVAQAAALWPGVSRNAATLAVARLRGFAADESNRLSREVGVPVTIGALAWRRRRPALLPGALSFAAALAALPLLRVVDDGPLWPWAAYRTGLALVLLGESAR